MAFSSVCIDSCTSINRVTWNIYYGMINSTFNTTVLVWTTFDQMNTYENIWFFGTNTTNLTALKTLFQDHSGIIYWRFEVIYTFSSSVISSSALNFIMNQPPRNGSCSINPVNGTTNTLFTISCSNWFDDDGIEDYSVFTYTTDISQKTILAFSAIATFEVRLPAGSMHLLIDIRDTYDCVTQWNITETMSVTQDASNISDLSSLLISGNQNVIGQILISLAQEFNSKHCDESLLCLEKLFR